MLIKYDTIDHAFNMNTVLNLLSEYLCTILFIAVVKYFTEFGATTHHGHFLLTIKRYGGIL